LKETNFMLSKVRIALAATIVALAAVSAVDSAPAYSHSNPGGALAFVDFWP
jgi:hypothetical protein